MNKRTIKTLIVALSMLMLLPGCWDTKDINKQYLPVVMGIGKGTTEKYRVVLQIPDASGKTQILDKEAKSISKAVDLIRTDSEKSIELVHLRLMLIDRQVAEQGIDNIINFAVRANDISIKGLVGVIDGDFEKTMYHEISPTPEISSYDFFSQDAGWTPNQSIVRIWEAYQNQNSYTEDMAIPMLKNGNRTLFTFKGTAVMRDDRMVGTLNQEETLLFNLFKGKYSGGTIEVAQNTSVLIQDTKVKHKTSWSENGPSILTDILLNVVITESPEAKGNGVIEKEMKEQLSKQFNQTVKKVKSFKSDVLGVGMIFRPQLSEGKLKEWKTKWFPKLEQKINVRVNVLNEIYFKENAKDNDSQGQMLKK
ncbi:Ger(x)C family spore germination protein [Paenibacillus sp. OK003]|uniref:Ger(x)C family spore germination protein n=1 Tax=Paenibacillus sp. OK003 TaxID=1884380 RepID=UPI0008AA99EC|nr:Ger(x)C family spore germination protein [Paenibacillus sp. OK003]SEL50022.1 germination protein, Ger(x)C family [Paenibacillus sp. OK003]